MLGSKTKQKERNGENLDLTLSRAVRDDLMENVVFEDGEDDI